MSNKELIDPPYEIICYALKVGDWLKSRDVKNWKIADCASRDALEAAEWRIAELEAERDEHPSAADYGELNERFNEAERKLDVARKALTNVYQETQEGAIHALATEALISIRQEALAQIGEKE